ncbi:uncharacterized protein LOC126054246 [Helicoverpa armigera]|uniref:uncharacterized protein LOC126054246 n=1 Tax=Helicoverpa armigera TaxID=29058 RepID=UPI0030831522
MKSFSDDIIKRHTKTVGERNEVDEALTMLIFCQDVLGQNLLGPNWSWKNKIVHLTLFFLVLVHVILGTIEYYNLKNMTEVHFMSQCYYNVAMICLLAVKYVIYISNKENFQKVYLLAKTSLFKITKMYSIAESKKLLTKVKVYGNILIAAVTIPLSVNLLAVGWNYAHNNRETLSKSTSTLMPMSSPYYEIGLLIHVTYYLTCVFTCFAIDLWFIILILFFCKTSDCLVSMLKIEQDRSVETEMEYMDRLNETLKTFYKNHVHLMEYFEALKIMFKWSSLIPLVGVLIKWCLILLSITEKMQWSFLANAMPAMLQILAYNWYGEQVRLKGSELSTALLGFDWTSMRNKDKKNYLIIICYMEKQFSIKTALGNDLSLVTMTSIFKASYQVFTLLRST